MGGFFMDLRYGARMLGKSPAITLLAVITLALGIGANTAIFSVVNAVLLRPLPYPEPDGLVFLWELEPQLPVMSVAYPDYSDWVEMNRSFDALGAFRRARIVLTGVDEPRQLAGAQASASLFSALRVEPVLGRTFLPGEDLPGAPGVVLLGHGLWSSAFGADPSILGESILLDGSPRTVIGVMPEGFSFPTRVEAWVPLGPGSADPDWQDRGNHPGIFGLARLRGGVSLEQARADMDDVMARIEQEHPDTNTDTRAVVTPLRELVVRGVRPALIMLSAAVALVLLIACANVANLMLGRAALRRREIGIRRALGAGRARLLRMLIVESTLLALLGGGLGLALTAWGLDALTALAAGSLPSAAVVTIDRSVLAFTLGISLLTGILFGMIPALQGSSAGIGDVLKESGATGAIGRIGHRLESALVISEVALALVLLVGAGLMTRSFLSVGRVDPGFDPDNVLTVKISLPDRAYPEAGDIARFFERLFEELRPLPGVETVAVTSNVPFVDGSQRGFDISGRPQARPGQGPLADYAEISPDYFRAMGTPLLRGREFTLQDNADAPRVAIIDEILASRYFAGEDPIGKSIVINGADTPENRIAIVGVARTIHLAGMDVEPPRPQMYFPCAQSRPLQTTLLLRATGDPAALIPAVRAAVGRVDANQPIASLRTLESIVAASLAPWRLNMVMIGLFSVLAGLLAAIGIYGVISYMVTQRTREIGIRMALGARRGDVVRMVLRQGLALIGAGLAIGLAASLALTRLVGGLLHGVTPTDPAAFLTVSVLLVATALLACWIPARRATRVDPMAALRCE